MNGSGPRLLWARPRSPSTLLQRCARMHLATYVGDVSNKLSTVHYKFVVHVHQNGNSSRISLHEQCIAGTIYPEWQPVVPQE
jgi:hypothetical protein